MIRKHFGMLIGSDAYTKEELEIAKAIMLKGDSSKDKIIALGAYYGTKDLADEYNMRNAIMLLEDWEECRADWLLGGLVVLLRDSSWEAYYDALANFFMRLIERI